MACSAARSAAVTGSKPRVFLLSMASAVRKNGRMVSPETPASWSTKLLKSMAVIPLARTAVSTYRRLAFAATGHPRRNAKFLPHNKPAWPAFAVPGKKGTVSIKKNHAMFPVTQLCKNNIINACFALDFCALRCNFCAAVAKAIVDLLGRFLPRLGPLANRERPFFLVVIPPPSPGRGAALRSGFRRGDWPGFLDRTRAARMRERGHNGARPCRAHD